MLKENATIVEIKDSTLWLQTEVKTTCGSCQHKDSCGTSSVAKAFSPKVNVIALPYSVEQYPDATVGDLVVIGVKEQLVVKSALYVYLLPIIGFMLAAFIAQMLIQREVLAIEGPTAELLSAIVAFAGGYWGYRVAKWRLALLGDGTSSQQLACQSQSNIEILSIEAKIPIKVEP